MHDEDTSPSLHRRAWDAIPWVAAGSASDEERQLVAQHTAACADCRDELAFHRGLRAAILAEALPTEDPGPALQRLWARIDQAQAVEPGRAGGPPAETTARHGLELPRIDTGPARGEAANAPAAPWRRGGWSRMLAVLVLLQAIGLTAALWPQPRSADYQTLSRATASTASIRLVPTTGLRIGELQALLARHGLEIVEISRDGALLGLAPQAGANLGMDETLAALRSEPGVLLAEPMPESTAAASAVRY